jgi:hypothetical protein
MCINQPNSGLGMVAQVVFDKAGDEVVAVVVAGVPAQDQRLAGIAAGGFSTMRVQLLGQELVGLALVHQQRRRAVAGLDQLGGVVFGPGLVAPR